MLLFYLVFSALFNIPFISLLIGIMGIHYVLLFLVSLEPGLLNGWKRSISSQKNARSNILCRVVFIYQKFPIQMPYNFTLSFIRVFSCKRTTKCFHHQLIGTILIGLPADPKWISQFRYFDYFTVSVSAFLFKYKKSQLVFLNSV